MFYFCKNSSDSVTGINCCHLNLFSSFHENGEINHKSPCNVWKTKLPLQLQWNCCKRLFSCQEMICCSTGTVIFSMWKQWTQEKEKSVMFTHVETSVGSTSLPISRMSPVRVSQIMSMNELPKVIHGGTEKSSMVSGLPPSFALVSSTFSMTSWGV